MVEPRPRVAKSPFDLTPWNTKLGEFSKLRRTIGLTLYFVLIDSSDNSF